MVNFSVHSYMHILGCRVLRIMGKSIIAKSIVLSSVYYGH